MTQTQEYVINQTVVDYVDNTLMQSEKDAMKEFLEAAIQEWIKEYSGMGFYKEEDYTISEIMLFPITGDRVLMFVHALLKDSDDGQVKLLKGKKLDDDSWEFDYGGLPNFYYEYSEKLRGGVHFTEHELMARTIDTMVEDGLLTFWGSVSQDYLQNKWF